MLLHSLIFLPQLASNTCSPHVFFRKGRKWARLSNFVVLFFSQPISLSLPSASLTILNKKKTLSQRQPSSWTPLTFLFSPLFLSYAMIVYTSLYYSQAAGKEGEVKEPKHHLVSECKRHKGTSLHHSITPVSPMCPLHAQYSRFNWQWWWYLCLMPLLYTSAPKCTVAELW